MVTQLCVHPGKAHREIEDTRGCHARFSFLSKNYIKQLNAVVDVAGDEEPVSYHRVCALKTYFLVLVGTDIFYGQKCDLCR